MVVLRFNYTEQHALEANREITRAAAPWVQFLPIAGLFMTAGLAYWWFVKDVPPWQGVNPLIVGPIFCLLPWFTRRQIRKNFSRSPEAGLEQVWRADEGSLAIETRGSSTRFEWNKLIRAKETKKGFLLFPQARLAYWIPLSAFSSSADMDTFRAYIRQSSIPTKL